jgi:glucose/arabinose dehydrogenase
MGSISVFTTDHSHELFYTAMKNPRSFIRRAVVHALCIMALLLLGASFFALSAATLPAGFTETQVTAGLTNPTAMAFAPDGRLFVCLQGGQLRVIKNGALLPAPFISLSVDSAGERGLLGVAFDPDFSTNHFVYVYYTVPGAPAHNRVSRFTTNGDVALAGSEVPILDLDNLSAATNHNGGAIHFGPDGKLYIAVGENANSSNSQTLTNLLGKVLRINPDGTIPANPFSGSASGKNKAIWVLGLRNPFTFDFQPGTGRMFINDVGEVSWEEINDGMGGLNYGWPITEGFSSDTRFRNPLFAYHHSVGPITGCAITGGAFYNPSSGQFPAAYIGTYFFADLCGGWIRRLDTPNGGGTVVSDFATGINQPVDLKVGPDGALYYLARGSSAVGKIRFVTTASSITATAGTPQSTVISTAFATQLQATVRDSGGNPVSNVSVVFTAPASGASGTFAGGTQSATVTTNSSGIATAPVFTANGIAGSYNVTAAIDSLSANFALTNTKATTTTTVTSSLNPAIIGRDVLLTARVTSGSGTPTGTVQFKDNGVALGAPVALVAGEATIHTSTLSIGNHVITAEYSGDNNFLASTGTLAGGQTINDEKIIRLGQDSYLIREDADSTPQHFPALTVEVKRVGDISAPATVQYQSYDAAFGECPGPIGQASSRCDYTAVRGTLSFAAGEAAKTFTIPIINDGYKEGSEVFLIEIFNAVGGAVGAHAIAEVTIEDDPADATPTTPAQNPYFSNEFFVRQNYLDFLLREPDANGFTDWVNVLNNCGPQKGFLGAPPDCDRAHVAHGFFASTEFIDRGYLEYRMYKVALNRLPQYGEFVSDMLILSGFNLTPAQQQQKMAEFLQMFTNKGEFSLRLQDVSQPSAAALLIQRLEQNAGVTLPETAVTKPGQPTQYGRQQLINLRANGTFTVGETVKAFAEQQAIYDKLYEPGEVTLLYFVFLKRDPSLNDPNLIGWNDWVDVFTNGRPALGIPPRDINHLIFGFIYSEEYRKRFGAP